MADYQLTVTDMVIRTADQAHIPPDPGNRDRIEYEAWLADGGVPDPYVPPDPPPPDPRRKPRSSTITKTASARSRGNRRCRSASFSPRRRSNQHRRKSANENDA